MALFEPRSYGRMPDDLIMPSIGIPSSRVSSDPVSPLAMFASSRIMLDNGAALMGRKLSRAERRQGSRNAYAFVGARGLAYSPLEMLG
jgi:hypothetical protein